MRKYFDMTEGMVLSLEINECILKALWNLAYGRLSGEALKDKEGVATMRNLGKNISWLLNRL